jgi:hypothetical protein
LRGRPFEASAVRGFAAGGPARRRDDRGGGAERSTADSTSGAASSGEIGNARHPAASAPTKAAVNSGWLGAQISTTLPGATVRARCAATALTWAASSPRETIRSGAAARGGGGGGGALDLPQRGRGGRAARAPLEMLDQSKPHP